ncbi:MAG TPA: acetate--CoA ligase family protein [Ktedonobacteraceae bacterium]|nr:acetate--CoA ligase family protein [Ktedonobacteraceae bacterium]
MQTANTISPTQLRAFFHPRSIALVGATDNSRWSIYTYQNLKMFGFAGPIYCVNPRYDVVHGQAAVKRLSDIQEPIDLAFIMVPTERVYSILEEVAAMGIPNAVILTSGFREMGAQGLALEQGILDYAQRHHITLLGPNGNGFVNVMSQTMPYGLPIQPPLVKGPVGIVLQSGALASAVISLAQARHIGLSLLVSMGNETMISATDVMNYLVEDEQTRVIAVFLESIRQPATFEHIARKALERGKPIVALKIGKSESSAHSAQAHTGALVGDDAINDAVFKQLGIIRVRSLEDLLTTAGLLGSYPRLPGRHIGFVTPSGGACDILSDRAEEENIQIPEFTAETLSRLQQVLPPFATAHNPLDVTGYIVVDRTLQQQALDIVVNDPGIDGVVFLSEPPRVEPPAPLLQPMVQQYQALGTMIRQSRIPILVIGNTFVDLTPFGRYISDEAGIHFVGGIEHGMTALGHALWWQEMAQQVAAHGHAQEVEPAIAPVHLPEVPTGNWSEYEARNFLQSQGIPVVPGLLVTFPEEAVGAAQSLGFPVALKIQGRDILHKSDIGGVLLNVADKNAVHTGFSTILLNAGNHVQDKDIDGILVSPMRPAGIEMLASVIHDPLWGQVFTIGLGGIWVEVFKDTSVRVLPVRRNEIKKMLTELRGAILLQGTRGQQPVNIEKLVDILFHITQVAQGLQEQLETLEINPLLLNGSEIEVLDALMTWKL